MQRSSSSQVELVVGRDRVVRLQQALLAWYRKHQRDLPWRRTKDPYAIWVSEIMLQQTRVETVKAYHERFLKEFPTIEALADSTLQEMLAFWSGLGYYSRARNLHAAARQLQKYHRSTFPQTLEEIRALPGIGPYTAGAIASIAFGLPTPLVDGNVIRVLSRWFELDDSPYQAKGQKIYWRVAAQLVPEAVTQENAPGDWNQALMELGATICLTQNPTCLLCPVRADCQAYQSGTLSLYPPKKPVVPVPTVRMRTLVIEHQNHWLLFERAPRGLWGGLLEPLTSSQHSSMSTWVEWLEKVVGVRVKPEKKNLRPLPSFSHILTHRALEFAPFLFPSKKKSLSVKLPQEYVAYRWVSQEELGRVGIAAWVKRLLQNARLSGA